MSKNSAQQIDSAAIFAALKPEALDELARDAYGRRRDVDLGRVFADAAGSHDRSRALRRLRRPGVRLGLASLTTAALVAGVLGFSLTRGEQHGSTVARPSTSVPVTASSFLLVSADRVTRVDNGTGMYWYADERIYQPYVAPTTKSADAAPPNSNFRAFVATTLKSWSGRNGRFHADNGLDPVVTFPTAADESAWVADGSPALSTIGHANESNVLRFTIGGRSLSAAQLAALPTDPSQLRAWLHTTYEADHAGLDEDSFIYSVAADILTTPTTSGTRAALYQLLAQLPGVRIIGTVHDPLGRTGTAIARQESDTAGDQTERRLIVDPGTGALLAQQLYEGPGTAATPVFWEAWQSLRWTDEFGG